MAFLYIVYEVKLLQDCHVLRSACMILPLLHFSVLSGDFGCFLIGHVLVIPLQKELTCIGLHVTCAFYHTYFAQVILLDQDGKPLFDVFCLDAILGLHKRQQGSFQVYTGRRCD